MGIRLRALIVVGAAGLSACQLLLGIESREVGPGGDAAGEEGGAESGDPVDAGDERSTDAPIDSDAQPPKCPVGTKACAGACVRTSDDPFHCGGCDHSCVAPCDDGGFCPIACDAGFCAVEPEIVYGASSNYGYFAANPDYYFVTGLTTTRTYKRPYPTGQYLGELPYADGDSPLDGFEASKGYVYSARLNGVGRVTSGTAATTAVYVGPNPGPPLLGLRVFTNYFFFKAADDLYGGIHGSNASLFATLTNLTTAIVLSPPGVTPPMVYITNTAGEIHTFPVTGGAPVLYASSVPSAVLGASTSDYLFFASRDVVWSVYTGPGSHLPMKIYEGAIHISDLRADVGGLYAYVLDRGDEAGTNGRVLRIPAAGGEPLILLKDLSEPLDLHLDSPLVYTLDRGMTGPAPHTVTIWGAPR